jgi:zinc transporter, ZIP family
MFARLLGMLPYVCGAAAVGLVGGGLSALWEPGPRLTGYIEHFAAGLVIAAVAVEILPRLEHSSPTAFVVLGGFAAGGGTMLAVKWFARQTVTREGDESGKAIGFSIATGVNVLMDGMIIGAGFVANPKLGVVLVVALGLELMSLCLSVGIDFNRNSNSARTALMVTGGIASMLPVGAVAGLLLLGDASNVVTNAFLSFGAAALLYLVAEELLVEAHVTDDTIFSSAMLLLGFLVMMALRMFILTG